MARRSSTSARRPRCPRSRKRAARVGFVRGERRRRGVARRSSRRGRPIGENSDYQTSTPSPRLIRARRILTKRRRGAGAVLRTPRRARRWRRVRLHARGHALAWLWRQRHRRRRRRGLGEETLLRGPCVARAAPGSWVRRRAAVAASTTSCCASVPVRAMGSKSSRGVWRDLATATAVCWLQRTNDNASNRVLRTRVLPAKTVCSSHRGRGC